MIYLGDSLAPQLIRGNCEISVTKVTPLDVVRCLEDESVSWQSCVSHDDTAAVFTEILGVNVPCYNGQGITLNPGDVLFIGPPILPEGTTRLLEGFQQLVWLRVERVGRETLP